jgi:hypothetical protein
VAHELKLQGTLIAQVSAGQRHAYVLFKHAQHNCCRFHSIQQHQALCCNQHIASRHVQCCCCSVLLHCGGAATSCKACTARQQNRPCTARRRWRQLRIMHSLPAVGIYTSSWPYDIYHTALFVWITRGKAGVDMLALHHDESFDLCAASTSGCRRRRVCGSMSL